MQECLSGMGLSIMYQTVYNNLQKIEAEHEESVRQCKKKKL